MRIKLFTCLLIMLAIKAVTAQNGFFMVSETETGANGFNNGKTTYKVTVYSKGEDMKVEMSSKTATQTQFFVGDKVTVITKEEKSEDMCGEGTREEMKSIMNEGSKTEYKDLKVEKTNKTETIMGYECKKVIIKYKISVMGFDMKMENVLWYTDKINLGNDLSTGDVNSMGVSNAYIDAVKALGGVVLKQESYANGTLTATTKTVQFEKKDIADAVFVIDTKGCKKMLTLKEHKDKIDEKNRNREMQELQFQQQMNRK